MRRKEKIEVLSKTEVIEVLFALKSTVNLAVGFCRTLYLYQPNCFVCLVSNQKKQSLSVPDLSYDREVLSNSLEKSQSTG